MSNERESRSLIPTSLDVLLDPGKRPSFSHLPHIQRLSGLVYVYLQASSRLRDQGERWLKTPHENIDLLEILKTPEFVNSWPLSETHNLWKFPEFMAKKIHNLGDPFGFSKEAMQAAFEMAEELSGNQIFVDELRMGSIDSEWRADQLDYFQSTMFDMYHNGRTVGAGGLSQAKFPAYVYWKELFPPEVAKEIEALEKSPKQT